jgi:hypothetical protein
LGGAMTSLILPKWTRSVGLNGIFTSDQFWLWPGSCLAETTKGTLSAWRKRADSKILFGTTMLVLEIAL